MGKLIAEGLRWLDWGFSVVPGYIGVYLRRAYLRNRLRVIGERAIVHSGVHFNNPSNIYIAHNPVIGRGSTLSADKGMLSIGHFLRCNTNVNIDASGGTIHIGSNVMIGPNVVIRASDHKHVRTDIPMNEQGHSGGHISIGSDCWICANVVITRDVEIGRGSIIAAGAVVTSDIKPYSIAGGVPARVISSRSDNPMVEHE